MEYICVDLQTGLFEAFKANAVGILEKELGSVITARPKVELYGMKSSEEKFLLDLEFEVNGRKYGVKLVIFNTKCCVGIQQKCPDEAVQETTVARYFYDQFLFKIAEILKNRLDISGLNEHCRKIASAGYKDNKNSKQSCYDCNKEIKTGKSLKCHMCKKHIHMTCAEKSIAFLEDMITANELVVRHVLRNLTLLRKIQMKTLHQILFRLCNKCVYLDLLLNQILC